MLGHPVRAADDFETCMALARSLDDKDMYALAFAFRGRISYQLGEHEQGIKRLAASLPLLDALGSSEEQAYSLSMLGHEHSLLGDFPVASAHHHQAVTIFQATGNSVAESAALNRVALSHAFRGDWERAIETAQQSVLVAGDSGIELVLGMATSVRGYALVFHHRSPEGLALLELGIRRIESSGSLLVLSRFCAWVAEAHALVGDVERGERWAERAGELVARGDRYGASPAYRSKAMLGFLARPSDHALVLDTLLQGEMWARSSGERPELAITLLRRAEVLHGLGEPQRTRESLNEALALFEAMGMDWWKDQALVLQATMDRGEPFNGFLPRTERRELGLTLFE
jgi:tetratricopeptide (TPR) repeat protein